ncbi:FIST C-terminal domain-containing protein [Desulfovibrio sp. OttesenSCG-928-O18]|nr:FIST C-terminal domain-containing protein [Desulfovibrio sp. OttesenSCG-928-O18]
MRSYTVTCPDAFDAEDTADYLLTQLEAIELCANSCALVFAEPEDECLECLGILHKKRPDIPFIGATSLAQLSPKGYSRLGMTMLVLTADDCWFGLAGTDHLGENGPEKIKKVYAEALAQLGGKQPEGAFVFSSLTKSYTEQEKLALLDELIGHKPVIGGIASDEFKFAEKRVFVNGSILDDGYAVILIAGKFKPVVAVGGVPDKGLPRYRITGSDGPVLKSIDDTPILEFLKNNDVNLESSEGLLFAPFSAVQGDSDENGQPVCRPLIDIDREQGTALSYVNMPQGSMVSFQIISAEDLKRTVEDAAQKVMDTIAASSADYEYSSVFCITCAGRHVVLAFEREYEADIAKKYFGNSMQYAGFYAFTEIGPTRIDADGYASNHSHNLSVIFCAF